MFFFLSKVFWVLIAPSTLLLALSVVTAVFYAVDSVRFKKSLRCLSWMLAVVYAAILILPIGEWSMRALEERPATESKAFAPKGIIVLGGMIDPVLSDDHKSLVMGNAAERLTTLLELSRKYPNAKLVFSGGSGSLLHRDRREQDYARMALRDWGMDIDKVTFESASRNTYENAAYSRKLVNPQANEQWLLVTSAAHMRRAYKVFQKSGWDVLPYPVDYRARIKPPVVCFCAITNLQLLDQLSYEIIGLIVYQITGKA